LTSLDICHEDLIWHLDFDIWHFTLRRLTCIWTAEFDSQGD
jgi:hypothetical protein